MAHIFDRIIAGGYWVPFGSFTEAQQRCKDATVDAIDDLFAVRQREKYVHEIKSCICGYPPADESEPMVPENFSQFQFYLPIEKEIIDFVDRFDFLICCVANGICKIHKGFEERYQRALLTVLTFRTAIIPASPQRVLDPELMKAPAPVYGEQGRSPQKQAEEVVTYLSKTDAFTRAAREELALLEAEEAAAEHRKREAADRAAGHNPYLVSDADATTAADEMTDAEREAIRQAATATLATIVTTSTVAPHPHLPKAEDPTPILSLILSVKAEEEARAEIERRRTERAVKIKAQNDAEAKAKEAAAAKVREAEQKAAEEEVIRLQKERIELERAAAEAERAHTEAARLRDIERSRVAAQIAADAVAADQRRLEEANERERIAREAAEKAAARQKEAAEREAIAREAASREFRRQQLDAGRAAIVREEEAKRLSQQTQERDAVDREVFTAQMAVDAEERAQRETLERQAAANAANAMAAESERTGA